jgi:hypothetical protein
MAGRTTARTPSSTVDLEGGFSALPLGWEERSTPDWTVFYFNLHNSTTTWDRPDPLTPDTDLPPAYDGMIE